MQAQGAPRRFFVFGHTQTTDPRFSLDDLAGATGRLDVMARAVTAALCLSHGLRDDTEVWTALPGRAGSDGPPRVLRFHGPTLRSLNPDERSTAALFRKGFGADVVPNGLFETAHPGLECAEMRPLEAFARFAETGPVVLLDKDGVDIRHAPSSDLAPPVGFVLSDHRPFDDAEAAAVREVARAVVSLGPVWLHGHHAITIVHDELDRRA